MTTEQINAERAKMGLPRVGEPIAARQLSPEEAAKRLKEIEQYLAQLTKEMNETPEERQVRMDRLMAEREADGSAEKARKRKARKLERQREKCWARTAEMYGPAIANLIDKDNFNEWEWFDRLPAEVRQELTRCNNSAMALTMKAIRKAGGPPSVEVLLKTLDEIRARATEWSEQKKAEAM
jgi:hypothetical protein